MLLFYRDGILRRREWLYDPEKESGSYCDIPLRTWMKRDPHVFLNMLGCPFRFEDGLTVRELFRNLKPWADVMEGLARMAFAEFCEEVEKGSTSDEYEAYSHIEVSGFISLDTVPDYERIERVPPRPGPDGHYDLEAVTASLGLGAPKITDRIETTTQWHALGILKKPEWDDVANMEVRGYVLDYAPICDWAHLPIRVDRQIRLRDDTVAPHERFLSVNKPLLNAEHPWVEAIRASSGATLAYELGNLTCDPSFFECIVRGCLDQWGFHYSPAGRDAASQRISDAVKEVKEGHPEPEDDDADAEDREAQQRARFLRSMIEEDAAAVVDPADGEDLTTLAVCQCERPVSPSKESGHSS